MVQRRPGLMAFPSGDIMRRSPVGGVTLNVGAQPEIVRQPTTVTESMIGAPGSGIPAVTFDQVMARQAAARRVLAQATAQRQQREQQQQTGGPFLPARPEGMPGISPRGRGALAGALAGLQYAGPQTQPTSFAQGLGVMGQAAMEEYDRAVDREAKIAEAERRIKLEEDELLATKEYRRQMLELKTDEIAASAAKSAATGDKTIFTQEKDLRKEHQSASKPFVEAKRGFKKLQNAAQSPPSGANDLALIFGYMKVLDPGSVVREGEFANAENTGGVPERIWNLYNKVIEGQRLSAPQRQNFIASARTQFAPYLDDQQEIEDDMRRLASSYNLDPDKVVMSKMPELGDIVNPYKFNSEDEANAANLPSGTYVLIG
ncbi:MAG: hypothetical protein CMI60_22440, partial [Parvibaculum sp.]|nr:hypothetical protein [Parvibaculum sp.]